MDHPVPFHNHEGSLPIHSVVRFIEIHKDLIYNLLDQASDLLYDLLLKGGLPCASIGLETIKYIVELNRIFQATVDDDGDNIIYHLYQTDAQVLASALRQRDDEQPCYLRH